MRSPRSRSQQIWCQMRALFLIHRWLSSHCDLPCGRGKGALQNLSFIRTLTPFMRAPPSWPDLPNALPPNTLGIWFQHKNFWGYKHSVYGTWSPGSVIRVELRPGAGVAELPSSEGGGSREQGLRGPVWGSGWLGHQWGRRWTHPRVLWKWTVEDVGTATKKWVFLVIWVSLLRSLKPMVVSGPHSVLSTWSPGAPWPGMEALVV